MAFDHHETLGRTRAFFDERAADWDAIISAEHPRRLRELIATLSIAPNARVLDVGCGTGVLFPILADILDRRGQVLAADLSFNMMRETGRRIERLRGEGKTCETLLLQADAANPPLASDCFDWIICNSCFPHFHDQPGALRTLARLLKPGGALAICHTESRDAINALHRAVGDAVGGHELPDAPAMGAMITAAGLTLHTLQDRHDAYLLLAQRTGISGEAPEGV